MLWQVLLGGFLEGADPLYVVLYLTALTTFRVSPPGHHIWPRFATLIVSYAHLTTSSIEVGNMAV